MGGILIHGDNLPEIRRIESGSVGLVYADPPFRTGRSFSSQNGRLAYTDRWFWDEATERQLEAALAVAPTRLGRALVALLELYGRGADLAFLVTLAPRLHELARVLTPQGVLVLHLDDTIGHLARVVLDAVFGREAFVNEIVWRYRRWPAPSRRLQRMHDVLLVYAASPNEHTFHALHGVEQLAESTLRTFGEGRQRAVVRGGRRRGSAIEAEPSAGPPLSDVWEIPVVAPSGKERTSYPTQKPEALLERVVLSFTNAGDVLLDPYCGSGTALAVAEQHGREWVGIDAAALAIETSLARLGAAVEEVRTGPVA